jgi:NDP-sugar pyrophosphorylase family protein
VQCVILAGGLGTRIASIGPSLPKALVPVAGQPFAHHQLTLLARAGVRQVVYCIGHKGQAIREYVGTGERWGIDVRYVDEGSSLRGTAGAVRLALDEGVLGESFFVLYGDSYLPIDYSAVWSAFERAGNQAGLMTVFRNQRRWDTSNVLFEEGQVVLYDKRRADPRASTMVYIDYGLSVLRRGTVERCVPVGGVVDLADVFHRLSLEGQLAGFEVKERFYEVGSHAGIDDLQRYLLARGSAQ